MNKVFYQLLLMFLTSCYLHDSKPQETVTETGEKQIKSPGLSVSSEAPAKPGQKPKEHERALRVKVSRTAAGQLNRPLKFQQIEISQNGKRVANLTTDENGQGELMTAIEDGAYVLSTRVGPQIFTKKVTVEGRGPFDWKWDIEK